MIAYKFSLKRLSITLILVVALSITWVSLANPASIYAQGYGEGPFGGCQFGAGCTTDDGTDLQAPEDDQSVVVVEVDGDDDGQLEQFIDETNSGEPDTYYDPGTSSATPVVIDVNDDDQEIWLFDSDGDGDLDSSYNPATGEILRLGAELDPLEAQEDAEPGSTFVPAAPAAAEGERAITGDSFGGGVYEAIGEQLQKLPEPVTNSIPFLLLFLIGVAALRFLTQERWEFKRAKQLMAYYERQKQLFFEKNNFIMLVSHYLRTPLTKIKAGAELLQSKLAGDAQVEQVSGHAKQLTSSVESVVGNIESDQGLQQIQATNQGSVQVLARSAPRFVVPMVMFVLFAFGIRFILIDFRIIDANWVEILIEVVLGVVLIQWFYSTLRKRQIARRNRLEQEQLLQQQQAIDQSRSQVIESGRDDIKSALDQLNQSLPGVQGKPQYETIADGTRQLGSVVSRFSLLGQLQASNIAQQIDIFPLYEVVQQTIDSYSAQIQAKQLAVNVDAIELPSINQHQQLVAYVVSTLLSNAIKYSPQSGTISVHGEIGSDSVALTVSDQGQGIPQDKLGSLFKPFYRAEDSQQFNQEGLGFNLYLSKVIMQYLGGDIELNSQVGSGTTAKVIIPLDYRQATE